MSLGSRIREFRQERGLTLSALAERIEVSPSFLSGVERDIKKPSVSLLQKIGSVLNISLSFLMADSDDGITGEKLQFMRKGRDLSLEDLAEISGIPAETIKAFEDGAEQPSLDQIEKLSESLNVTIRYFMERSKHSSSIGERVRRYRENQSLTQAALAAKADVSSGLISQIENDQTMPSMDTLEKIAQALGTTSCNFLLNQEDSRELLASLSPELLALLGEARVQAVLRAVRDLEPDELKYILNYLEFFKRNRNLLSK